MVKPPLGTLGICIATMVVSACGGSASTGTPGPPSDPSPAASAVPATATPNITQPFERVARLDRSQSIDSLRMTVIGAGAGTPHAVFDEEEAAEFMDAYPDAKTIIVVEFTVENLGGEVDSLLAFLGTTALVNNEQVDADFLLSDMDSEVLPGALVEMKAVFLSERFLPSEVETVRFRVEKEFSFDGEKVFDFTVEF